MCAFHFFADSFLHSWKKTKERRNFLSPTNKNLYNINNVCNDKKREREDLILFFSWNSFLSATLIVLQLATLYMITCAKSILIYIWRDAFSTEKSHCHGRLLYIRIVCHFQSVPNLPRVFSLWYKVRATFLFILFVIILSLFVKTFHVSSRR